MLHIRFIDWRAAAAIATLRRQLFTRGDTRNSFAAQRATMLLTYHYACFAAIDTPLMPPSYAIALR